VERGQRSYGFALMGYTVPIVTVALTVNPHVANNGQSPLSTRNDISKSASSKDFLDD
jgi:hypothetical protein